MSNQRLILGDFFNQPSIFYHATFDHLSHYQKSNYHQPVILLLNLYLVDQQDKKIKINRSNIIRDIYGRCLITDHIWVDVNSSFFNCIPQELLYGDELYFKADVEEYPISRANVVTQRNLIWEKTQELNNSIFQSWRISRKQFKGEQYAIRLASIKAEIRQNNLIAQQQQRKIKMVDYGLTNIRSIHVSKYLPTLHYRNFQRIHYNLNKINADNYLYSKWLSRRTIQYKALIKNKH